MAWEGEEAGGQVGEVMEASGEVMKAGGEEAGGKEGETQETSEIKCVIEH